MLPRRWVAIHRLQHLGHAVDVLDAQNIIFNTDYPHGDSPMPGAVGMFLEQPISDAAKRKILSDNALALYGSRLHPSVASTPFAAARIGE